MRFYFLIVVIGTFLSIFSTIANAQNTPTRDEQANEIAKTVLEQTNNDWEKESIANAKAALDRGDNKTAFLIIHELAKAGNGNAQSALGMMYFKGQGVQQNYNEAAKWFHKASDQGNGQSSKMLGFLYFHGQGVPQDYKESMKWYRKAADQGEDVPIILLGDASYPCPGCSKKNYDEYKEGQARIEGQLEHQRLEEEMDEMHGDVVIQQMEQEQRMDSLEQHQDMQQQQIEQQQKQQQLQQEEYEQQRQMRYGR